MTRHIPFLTAPAALPPDPAIAEAARAERDAAEQRRRQEAAQRQAAGQAARTTAERFVGQAQSHERDLDALFNGAVAAGDLDAALRYSQAKLAVGAVVAAAVARATRIRTTGDLR